MIWLTLRHYRLTVLLGVVILALLIPVFVQDAQLLQAALQEHGYVHCFDYSYAPCGIVIIPNNTAQWRTIVQLLWPLLSCLVGVFLGAPLVAREYEQRTHYFAWTQSLSRVRWLSILLLILGGVTFIGFGLFSLVTTWWGFIQDTIAHSPWDTFMIRGSVPVATALFSLMLGVMIGTLIRRTLLSMVLTLLLLPILLLVFGGVYPHLLPPSSQPDYYNTIRQEGLMGKFGLYSQDLIVAVKYVGQDGKVVEDVGCGFLGPYISTGGTLVEVQEIKQCYERYQVKPLVKYHRFSERFWPLQVVSTAVLLILTLVFATLTYWQLQRRTL